MKEFTKAEKIINIATKRGFFFPTAEIYKAKAGFWTYGHLGFLVKQKWENLWRDFFLSLDDNYFEIDGNYILPKAVFEGSGHLENFKDPLTHCEKCNFRFRADELIEDELSINVEGLTIEAMDKLLKENNLKCPKCGGKLGKVRAFNMMFEIGVGAAGKEICYLSPETAQNPYLSFKREFSALREKLPMGLAMIGRAFRNEIAPRKGFFRLREFNQAELQIFFDPANIDKVRDWNKVKDYKLRLFLVKDRKKNKIEEIDCEIVNKKLKLPKFYVYHLAKIQQFYLDLLKIPKEKFRFRELSKEERAFYNKIHFDMEVDLESLGGFKEVGGVHYRSDHDLSGHQKGSGEKLKIKTDDKEIMPNVLELSFGVDRNIWALLDIFYKEEKERTLFEFPSAISPFDVAIFPLVRTDKSLVDKGKEVYEELKKEFKVFYDENASIGRRYARQDEIGTKLGITIDEQTLKDETVTMRDLDTTEQIRVKMGALKDIIQKVIGGEDFLKLGKRVDTRSK